MMYPVLVTALFLFCSTALLAVGYTVDIQCPDKSLKKAFTVSSQTLLLKDKTTLAALRRRASKDKEKFEDLAHYYGYYSAVISYSIHNYNEVIFQCALGPKYRLESCNIVADEINDDLPKLQMLNLQISEPITSQQILDAEKKLLWLLKKKGYAQSSISKKECIAHAKNHTLAVTYYVKLGPIVHFGPTQVVGSQNVLRETINKYIIWKEGQLYNPADIEKTQQHLEKTGLFSSVIITESSDDLQNNNLPLTINVQESKHHSIGAGVAYATSFGPGIKASWENKNLRGSGDRLTFRTEVWEKYQKVLLSLTKPHFHDCDQDFIWIAEYDKLRNIAFDSRSYNLSAILQKRLSRRTETMAGLRAEWLHSRNFEGSQYFHIVKIPLQLKWSNANNLLDPTKGQTYNVKITPATNFYKNSFFYAMHTSTLSGYHSVFNNHLTFAAKIVFGNIMGAARNTIPPPDRFYGGSENVLRGFRAYTVSPLHNKKTPIGGRSMLAASLEARFRTAGDLGYVLFYDAGNVYTKNIPELRLHQYHSVGIGLRYATPIGPLRFDVAVPLNPRRHIDPHFQIYFSIGQSF